MVRGMVYSLVYGMVVYCVVFGMAYGMVYGRGYVVYGILYGIWYGVWYGVTTPSLGSGAARQIPNTSKTIDLEMIGELSGVSKGPPLEVPGFTVWPSNVYVFILLLSKSIKTDLTSITSL